MTSIAKNKPAKQNGEKREHHLSELSSTQTVFAGVHSARAQERNQYSINDKPTLGGQKA
jgi:hypothetical protein